jgi:hypothetical protein
MLFRSLSSSDSDTQQAVGSGGLLQSKNERQAKQAMDVAHLSVKRLEIDVWTEERTFRLLSEFEPVLLIEW